MTPTMAHLLHAGTLLQFSRRTFPTSRLRHSNQMGGFLGPQLTKKLRSTRRSFARVLLQVLSECLELGGFIHKTVADRLFKTFKSLVYDDYSSFCFSVFGTC